ncbi:MAG: tetratricopeptide repeat protein [Chloroflexota bacterium]|nr:tetratricopeptide repeat protein [Chloroflexota bacterium]
MRFGLVDEDRKILQLGAVQGEQFLSLILAGLLEQEQPEALDDRLQKVIEQHRIINYCNGDEWTKERSETYTFEHILMQQAFYNKLSPFRRRRYHRRVAELLERMLSEQPNPLRKLVLEVAHHYDHERGDEPLSAAQYYYQAAQSSFADGAFVETADLCQQALENLRTLAPEGAGRDRLQVEIIQLLLIASETRWRGKPGPRGELSVLALVGEAEAAASRTGERALLAQVKLIKGRVLVATGSVIQALQSMQEALDLACASGDPLAEFTVLSVYGHQKNKENLAQGLALLYQAHDLYEQRLKPAHARLPPVVVSRSLHRLQGALGVGEFDRGQYDVALGWLQESIAGLKRLNMHDDLLIMLNFLGQLYAAMGLFERARDALDEAIALLKDEQEPHPWNGYNLALLGKLYLEWGRVQDAAEPLQQGWRETQATWQVDLATLVRNYYAELLMQPGYAGHDLVEAERLLAANAQESQANGLHRSTIAALSLRGRLALARGDTTAALRYSTAAVDSLEEKGTMPALRTEEVLFNQYRVLQAAGLGDQARDYLARAYATLQQKADGIKNEDDRWAFLERVPTSRAIRVALGPV